MRNNTLLPTAAMAFVLSFISAVNCFGQTFTDNFDDSNDDGWAHYDPLGGGSFTFPGGAYQISTTPPANADFGAARVGSILSGVTTADFHVSVDLVNWDETLPETFGIIARANDVGLGTTTGYLFTYSPGASAGRSHTALAIERLDGEQVAAGGSYYYLPEGDLVPDAGYRMVFLGIGDQFYGSIYALSDLDTPIGTVNYTDDTYSSGGFGLLVADSNAFDLQGATATFDNYSLTVVPEPANVALFVALAGVVFAISRGRYRQD